VRNRYCFCWVREESAEEILAGIEDVDLEVVADEALFWRGFVEEEEEEEEEEKATKKEV
jgi:hypothetical protein